MSSLEVLMQMITSGELRRSLQNMTREELEDFTVRQVKRIAAIGLQIQNAQQRCQARPKFYEP